MNDLKSRLWAASEGFGEVPPIISTLGMKLIRFGEGNATQIILPPEKRE